MNLDDVIQELRDKDEIQKRPLKLPTQAEVTNAEDNLNTLFHPDYRKYLLKASDITYGNLKPCILMRGYDERHLVVVTLEAWCDMGVPKDLLPICENDGDYYCMNNNGEIVLWRDGALKQTWENLAAWIKKVWIGGETC